MEEVNEKEIEISLKEFGSDSDGISSRDNSDSISSKNTDEGEVSIADEFEILEKVGEGGMGSVYKVRDKSLDKVFAVKVLKKDIAQDQSAYKRFEQEAEATSKLLHQNVISTYKYGRTESGQPYLVMDYLEGRSLAEYIEEKSLNTDQIIDIFIQICQGLEHAHENKIIHRDIKPTNIILNPNASGSFDVKILDFGIAKVIDGSVRETHNLTQTGEVYGSPQYMSPEQCLGFMLEEQSDIYSLGCTLYETITGKPPFAGANPIQLVVKHINEDVEEFKARHRSNKKQKQLEKITFKCLEKEQADRIQSASILRRDLESIRNGKAIPNYILKPKEKSERRHHYNAIIGAITCASVWKLLYSNVALVQDYFWVGLMLAIGCLYCFCVFSSTAIAAFKKLIKGKENIKKWWIACMSSSAALIGFGAFFQLAIKFSYQEPIEHWAPFQILQLNSIAILLVFVAAILLIASSLGYIAFKKVKETNFIVTILAHLALLASAIAIPSLVIPNTVADLTEGFAETTEETLPEVSEFFLARSCSLTSHERKRKNYKLLAEIQFDNGNKKGSD